jgi:hypothetical protein
MLFPDQSIETSAEQVQKLTCSDVGVLRVFGRDFLDTIQKKN